MITTELTTTSPWKSTIPLDGQIPSSASTATTTSLANRTAGGGLFLVAQSDAGLAGSLTIALLGQQVPTITTIPPGMVVQSVTTVTKCSHAFAMATTTLIDSIMTTDVPKVCRDDAAFLLIAGPATSLLCTKALSFLGFLLRWICDPKTGTLIGVDVISPTNPPHCADLADDPTPNPKDDPQDGDDKPSNTRDSSERAFSTTLLSTSCLSSKMTTSASSAAASPYYLFSGIGDENEVSDLLGKLNSRYKALQPAVGATSMSGADWANINLTVDEVASLSPNPNVLLLAPVISQAESTSISGNEVSTSAFFSTLSSHSLTASYTLSTSLSSLESSSSSKISKMRYRRFLPSHQFRKEELSARGHHDDEMGVLTKRDSERNILAQYGLDNKPCPRDLAVISWAPRVPAVLEYPYLFLQSQGEGTWAYLVSSGIEKAHVASFRV